MNWNKAIAKNSKTLLFGSFSMFKCFVVTIVLNTKKKRRYILVTVFIIIIMVEIELVL